VPARRCSLCGINYPNIPQFYKCPIHDEATQWFANVEPDKDWQGNHERLDKQIKFSTENHDRAFPIVRGVVAVEEDGRYFVDQTEMQRAGVRLSRMQPDQFYLFELEDGWVYETQGWAESRRMWWVERVAVAIVLPTAPLPSGSA